MGLCSRPLGRCKPSAKISLVVSYSFYTFVNHQSHLLRPTDKGQFLHLNLEVEILWFCLRESFTKGQKGETAFVEWAGYDCGWFDMRWC